MTTLSIMHKLGTQMNADILASQRYLKNSSWCAAQSLNGCAELMRQFAQRNISFTVRLFNYLKQKGINPDIEADDSVSLQCESLDAIFKQMLSDNLLSQGKLADLKKDLLASHHIESFVFIESLLCEQKHNLKLIEAALEEVQRGIEAGDDLHETDERLRRMMKRSLH